MLKASRKVLTLLMAIAIVVFSVLSLSASDLTVNGGNLVLNSNTSSAVLTALTSGNLGTAQSQTSGIGFGSITIFMATTIAPISASDYIRVDDNRGTSVGWNTVISATDLTATVDDETTSTEGATATVTIPIDSVLAVTPNDPTAINSSDLTNVAKQNVGSAVTNSGVKIFAASNGYGAGTYMQELDYTLSMPNYLPFTATIVPTDAAGSKFADRTGGSKLPLLAGTYTTTATYAISTGP